MNETIIESLFYSIREGTLGVYEEMSADNENDKRFNELIKETGLDREAGGALSDIYAADADFAERHGFEQGFKLGFKLAAEIYAAK